MDILAQFKNEIDTIKADVKRDVEVALLRETIRWNVSRLMAIDTNQDQLKKYNIILDAIGTV